MCNYAEGLQGIKTFNYLQKPYKTGRTKNEAMDILSIIKKPKRSLLL